MLASIDDVVELYFREIMYRTTAACFRLFTKESLTKIERRVRDDVEQADDLQPNPLLEIGRTLPARLGEFPPELYGKPIEELDEYYLNKYVSV